MCSETVASHPTASASTHDAGFNCLSSCPIQTSCDTGVGVAAPQAENVALAAAGTDAVAHAAERPPDGDAVTLSAAPAAHSAQHVQHAHGSAHWHAQPELGPADIEEAGLVKDRIAAKRFGALSVTDIASAEWCQQQVAYNLTSTIPKARLLAGYLTGSRARCIVYPRASSSRWNAT